jgi:hypothetical protein
MEAIILPKYDQARLDYMKTEPHTCTECGLEKLKGNFQIRKRRSNKRGETQSRWRFDTESVCKVCANAAHKIRRAELKLERDLEKKAEDRKKTGHWRKSALKHTGFKVNSIEYKFLSKLKPPPLSIELRENKRYNLER